MNARKKILGDYHVGKTIGQGAFSKVKIGFHRETGEKVAIKIVDKKQMAEKAAKAKASQDERERRKRGEESQKRAAALIEARAHGDRRLVAYIHQLEAEEAAYFEAKAAADAKAALEAERLKAPSFESRDRSTREVLGAATQGVDAQGGYMPDFVKRLQVEVQLLMRLEHPNVIRIFQVLETEDECYIIMEYASGGELVDYIAAKSRLTEKEARKYFRQMVSAMDHCHQANVVHRDLKLENLLLNADRNILISDFGLGRTFRSDIDDYMRTFCGTPNYAAVELISGIPYIGVKADIWAMGVILYIMMTGEPPFIGENINALYTKIKSVEYNCPATFSPELKALLAKILVKDPAARVTMDGILADPWVNLDEPPLARTLPAPAPTGEAVNPTQFIKGITFDSNCIIYSFHQHTVPKKPAFDDLEIVSKRRSRSNSVAHDDILRAARDAQKRHSLAGPLPLAGSPSDDAEAGMKRTPTGSVQEEDEGVDSLPPLPGKFPSKVAQDKPAPPPTVLFRRMSLQEQRASQAAGPGEPRPVLGSLRTRATTTDNMSPSANADDAGARGRRATIAGASPKGGADRDRRSSSGSPSSRNSVDAISLSASSFSSQIMAVPVPAQVESEISFHRRMSMPSVSLDPAHTAGPAPMSAAERDAAAMARAAKRHTLGAAPGPGTAAPVSPAEALSPGAPYAAGSPNGAERQADSTAAISVVDALQPSFEKIQEWHMIHRPPKSIRSVRFSFSSVTTSVLAPTVIFQDLHRIMILMQAMYPALTFTRVDDYYCLNCKVPKDSDVLQFEVEICKVWLMKLHGIRIKRISGSALAFKEMYSTIVANLAI